MKARGQIYLVACMVVGSVTACLDESAGGGEVGESEASSALTTPQFKSESNFSFLPNTSLNIVQGGPCSPFRTRSHFTVERSTGSGHCDSLGWYSQDAADCRAYVHVGANFTEHGTCTTRVYEWPATVVIFTATGWGGDSKRLDSGTYTFAGLGIPNDSLSSLRVPLGWTVYLFDNETDLKPMGVFTHDASDIGAALRGRTSKVMVFQGAGPN